MSSRADRDELMKKLKVLRDDFIMCRVLAGEESYLSIANKCICDNPIGGLSVRCDMEAYYAVLVSSMNSLGLGANVSARGRALYDVREFARKIDGCLQEICEDEKELILKSLI